ncbi:coenzyme A pyrophosphatase [Vibrio navarrensis]|uniref:CoA pyrophosphatase n=1 Tax=Vibrio navarrensis TaxID=29495 RepID=UPI003CC7F61C|nr:coenzyme A pyrophosphatase [Vibrio navarrensis]
MPRGATLLELNRDTLLQKFQLHLPVGYHAESLGRVAHLNPAQLRKAAVLVGFVERSHGLNVILTKRASHLKHHPGQISFPGGKFEPDDSSLVATALRETFEEVGITPSQISVFGQMPELVTVSRYKVTPILAFVATDYQTRIDRNEVEEVFEVPVRHLLDRQQLRSAKFRVNQSHHRVFAIPYQHHFIWGMTAQIIHAMQQQLVKLS